LIVESNPPDAAAVLDWPNPALFFKTFDAVSSSDPEDPIEFVNWSVGATVFVCLSFVNSWGLVLASEDVGRIAFDGVNMDDALNAGEAANLAVAGIFRVAASACDINGMEAGHASDD
jgi:hypothetical protein